MPAFGWKQGAECESLTCSHISTSHMILVSFKKILSLLFNTAAYRNDIAHRIYSHLNIDKNAPLLDTSCGEGELLRILSENNYSSLYGIDTSEDSLSKARVTLESFDVHLSNQNILNTHFDPAQFDTCISSLTLHHIDNPDAFFSHIKTLLPTKGQLIIADYLTLNPVHSHLINSFGCPEAYSFNRFYAKKELVDLAQKHDFRLERSATLKTSVLGRLELLQFSKSSTSMQASVSST